MEGAELVYSVLTSKLTRDQHYWLHMSTIVRSKHIMGHIWTHNHHTQVHSWIIFCRFRSKCYSVNISYPVLGTEITQTCYGDKISWQDIKTHYNLYEYITIIQIQLRIHSWSSFCTRPIDMLLNYCTRHNLVPGVGIREGLISQFFWWFHYYK